MQNKTYDILKKVALMIVPFITFLTAVGDIWNIPHTTEITATLAALDTLIGALLSVSSSNYWKEEDSENVDK